MNPLEKILGSTKFNSISETEKNQIKELIIANPIYEFLVAGIVGGPNWQTAISDAYSKYVRPAQEEKTIKVEKSKNKNKKTPLFGAGDFDNFSKSGIMM